MDTLQVYDEATGRYVVAGHEEDEDFQAKFWHKVLHSLCDAGYVFFVFSFLRPGLPFFARKMDALLLIPRNYFSQIPRRFSFGTRLSGFGVVTCGFESGTPTSKLVRSICLLRMSNVDTNLDMKRSRKSLQDYLYDVAPKITSHEKLYSPCGVM